MSGSGPCVLGIDPGPTTGMCLISWPASASPDRWRQGPSVTLAFECNMAAAGPLLGMLLTSGTLPRPELIAIEQFVDGRRSVRLRGVSSAVIRSEITLLALTAGEHMIHVAVRPAAMVKPWAADERLGRAGLLEPTAGLADARDAARHALYCACKDLGLPDPLARAVRG